MMDSGRAHAFVGRTFGLWIALVALAACGGGGATDPGSSSPDAGPPMPTSDAGPGDDAAPGDDDAGPTPMDAAMPADDAATPTEDAGPACPTGYAGEDCAECAPGYTDFGGVCVLGCDAVGDDALDCGVGGECMISPADGTRFCACSDGYAGAACDTCREGWSPSGSRCTLDPPPALGLALWLDADDSDSIDVDGAMRVTAWRDHRGLGDLAATPTTTITRPTYRPTGRNDRGAIDFDGVDDQLALSSFTGLSSTDIEVVVAGEFGGDAPVGIFAALTGTSGWAFLVERTSSTDLTATYRSTPGATGGVQVVAERGAPNRPMWVSVTHQTSAPNDTLVIFAADGATDAAAVHLFPMPSTVLPSPLNLRFGRTQNGRLTGPLYEVLIYSRRLSVAERAQVTLYLREKWDLP